jgi:hypothetical protein
MSSTYCKILACGGMCLILVLPGLGYKVGDIVSGEIVSEDKKVLVLRKDPCDPDSATVAFSAPWKKRKVESKACPDKKEHEVYEVEQLQTPCDKPAAGDKTNKSDEGCAQEASPGAAPVQRPPDKKK